MKTPLATSLLLALLVVFACLARFAAAQGESSAAKADSEGADGSQAEKSTTTKPAMPSIIQKLPNYMGDWRTREYLTGDWGGARTELAEHGILFDLNVTQNLQGVGHGGANTKGAFEYGGSADYILRLDTARMGLWPGGMIYLHGETQIGTSVNNDAGSFMSPNYKALLPVPGEPGITTLSEYYIMQALSEKIVLIAGKLDPTALADRNAFAGDTSHTTQFMNTAFNINPIVFSGGPYTTLGAGVILMPTDWLQIANIIIDNDPDGAATTTGFNTAFHSPEQTTVGQEYDFTLKPFDKVGHQRFGWMYTNRDFAVFNFDSRIPFPRERIGLPGIAGRLLPRPFRKFRVGKALIDLQNPQTRSDNYCFYYNFDQYLVSEAQDPTQGWGLFGRFGVAPTTGNLFSQFYSIGLGGKGTIPQRDKDTWGLGYYFGNVDNNVGSALSISNEQGIEMFYNIEVTPWFHITPDFQIIVDPAGNFGDRTTALVYGLRGQITF
jgi:porin